MVSPAPSAWQAWRRRASISARRAASGWRRSTVNDTLPGMTLREDG
ncbi:Uncharacterised protein [Bordetella pertussis]|nr:Uncharacterised protein [Bordetella pertussis]